MNTRNLLLHSFHTFPLFPIIELDRGSSRINKAQLLGSRFPALRGGFAAPVKLTQLQRVPVRVCGEQPVNPGADGLTNPPSTNQAVSADVEPHLAQTNIPQT